MKQILHEKSFKNELSTMLDAPKLRVLSKLGLKPKYGKKSKLFDNSFMKIELSTSIMYFCEKTAPWCWCFVSISS